MLKEGDTIFHESPIPISTFNKLLEYFYLGTTKSFTLKDCGWILSVADFYLLQNETGLLQFCDQMINSRITASNWHEALQLALELGHEKIKQKSNFCYSN